MKPISLIPDRFGVRRDAAQALFSRATVLYIAAAKNQHIDEVIKAWPGLKTKAAVTPSTMADFGSVAVLADDIVRIIAPTSAFSALVANGIRVDLAGVASRRIPARVVSAADAGSFVGEGQPIPVTQSTIAAGVVIAPCKLACVVVLTRELAEYSDAVTVMTSLMSDSATLKLDSVCLGNGAAIAGVQPAGILFGQAAAGAATSNTSGAHLALMKDVELLVNALAANGGGVSPVFICAPGQAAAMKTLVGPKFDYPIIASVGVPVGTLIAIEGPSFVSGFSGVPEFFTATQAVLHMESVPAPFSTVGTPNVVAAPERSLYQSDCVAVKMILRCGWGMRSTGHAQYLTGVNW